MYTHVCIYIYICIFTYVIHMWVCVDVFVHACMYMNTYICTLHCSKMTSLWFKVTSCPSFICKDAVISPPTARE